MGAMMAAKGWRAMVAGLILAGLSAVPVLPAFTVLPALAAEPAGFVTRASASTLPPSADEAFRLSSRRAEDGGLVLSWRILPGHYLYRAQFTVTADGRPATLATPDGVIKDDPTFGPTEIYHDRVEARVEAGALEGADAVTVRYQGCAEDGICYPPVTRTIDVASLAPGAAPLSAGTAAPAGDVLAQWQAKAAAASSKPAASNPAAGGFVAWQPKAVAAERPAGDAGATSQAAVPAGETAASPAPVDAGALAAATTGLLSGPAALVLVSFLGFGVLLAFTPCVFPMIPILSGLIVQASAGRPSRGRGFVLSSAYVLAMAAAYGLVGIAAAWSGLNLQVMLQKPAVIGAIALVFVALALSMFGLFSLALPAGWNAVLTRLSGGRGGSVGGAALLGFGSALVVGPCVTPPLAAALIYVAQSGDIARGAGALFALGLGMGLPLVAFGTFGAGFLPRAGRWLDMVRHAFGFVFLGLAVFMAGRVLPQAVTMALWGGLALAAGLWLAAWNPRAGRLEFSPGLIARLAGGAVVASGVVLVAVAGGFMPAGLVSAALTSANLAAAPSTSGGAVTAAAFGRTVTTPVAFDAALAEAQAAGRPVLVDFTADWCTVCHEIDRTVMADPAVRARLAGFSVIRADVTDGGPQAEALMQRFSVVGPPTMFVIDPATGREIDQSRIIGLVEADAFGRILDNSRA